MVNKQQTKNLIPLGSDNLPRTLLLAGKISVGSIFSHNEYFAHFPNLLLFYQLLLTSYPISYHHSILIDLIESPFFV
jgi:hypothetical protein